jgi:nitrogen PTS system EIIA component
MTQDEVLTTTEAVKYLKTSRQTIINLVKSGRLRGNKIGRNYRFLKEDLDRLIRGETEDLKAAAR